MEGGACVEASVDIAVGFEPSWREVLEEAAKWGASKRLCTMFDIHVRVCFTTTAEFLKCDETKLVKSQRGLGKKMEELVAHLRSFFCADRYRKRKEEERIATLEARVVELEARLGPARCEEDVGGVTVTPDDLLAVGEMMERFGIAEMDLRRMAVLLKAVRCGRE